MIVMAIFALVMGIAGVSYQRFASGKDNNNNEITAISDQIQAIRLKAIAQKKIIKLDIRDIFSLDMKLCDNSANGKAIFYKNGTVALGEICIIDPKSIQKTVLVDWTTGAAIFVE